MTYYYYSVVVQGVDGDTSLFLGWNLAEYCFTLKFLSVCVFVFILENSLHFFNLYLFMSRRGRYAGGPNELFIDECEKKMNKKRKQIKSATTTTYGTAPSYAGSVTCWQSLTCSYACSTRPRAMEPCYTEKK